MGSTSGTKQFSRLPIVKQPDLTGLRKCVDSMGPVERISFTKVYGNLLWLLKLDVQTDAIRALSRYYDPDTRCFFFRDCHLSPTLEEYSQILGFPQLSRTPYQYQGAYYSAEQFATLLHVSLADLKLQTTVRNEVTVFPQVYLESRMTFLAQQGKWGLFKQLLALVIFGVILFPQMDGYVSSTAVGIFLAFRDKENPINPVPAMLADTFCTFTHHAVRNGKRLSCSLHVLYAWFLVHTFTNKAGYSNLIEYAVGCSVPEMSVQEWSQWLGALLDRDVCWFLPTCWADRPKILFQCGVFRNVPLMGTKGCINYNPSLTMRQLGYPMRRAPTSGMLYDFYIHGKDQEDKDLLRHVLQSWEKQVYKGKTEFSKGIDSEEMTFEQWLYQKIQKVNLSRGVQPVGTSEPRFTNERVDDYQFALLQAKEEQRALQEELAKMTQKNKELEDDLALKSLLLEESREKCRKEEEETSQALGSLMTTRERLKKCAREKNEALREAGRWRGKCEDARSNSEQVQNLLEKSLKDIDMWARQCESLERERDAIEELLNGNRQALRAERRMTDDLKHRLRDTEKSYQQILSEKKYWVDCYIILIDKMKNREDYAELQGELQRWKDKFLGLVETTNQAMVGIPRNLRRAEDEMNSLNTPPAVYKFVEFCREMVNQLKGKTQEAAARKKRKKDGDIKALCP